MKPTLVLLRAAVSCLVLCFSLVGVQAQMRVGQPAGTPDPSAALDVSGGPYGNGSQYRGILPPKVALTQTSLAAPVTNPATGLLIYNTAKTGDVMPGYYYWEGSKWVRLSTATTGASREAALTAGTPIAEYTVAQVRSWTTSPGSYTDVSPQVFMLVEEGKEGLFRYDFNLTYADPAHPERYPTDDGVMTIITAGRSERGDRTTYRRVYDSEINVKWFGAKGDGVTNDTKAIQDAIDYARSKNRFEKLPLYAGGGGTYRTTILIPEGNYYIDKTIDVTNTSGILIKGVGGRYINTSLVGCGDGAILDFTGSSMSGCENLTFVSFLGYPKISSIGVQFALAYDEQGHQLGGLNCLVRNCYFQMADNPSANNGLGTIGILNCRSEEFAVTDCSIRANLGVILTDTNNLSTVGYNYTVHSDYATVGTGMGSMGVVNFTGQNSIQNYGLGQPALVLNGTNTVNFHGYFGRGTLTGSSTNEAAILLGGPANYNLNINATVESFAQLIRLKTSLLNSTISAVLANQFNVNPSSSYPTGTSRPPVIDLTGGGRIQGSKLSVVFTGDQSELSNRYLLYDNGPTIADNQLFNNEIICQDWTNTDYIASANTLSNTVNTSFKTAYPFEKRAAVSLAKATYISGSATIDPSLYDVIAVNNGPNPVTITIDQTKVIKGQKFTIKRADHTSTGPITIQASNPSYKIQTTDGHNNNSATLPTNGDGIRQLSWYYNGGGVFELFSGGTAPAYTLPSATPTTLGGVKLKTSQSISWSSPTSTTITVDLSLGSEVRVYNTGSGKVTLAVDLSTATNGMTYSFGHYDSGSIGPVEITTTTATTNNSKIEDASGGMNANYVLSQTPGQRNVRFDYYNTNILFFAGSF